MMKLLPTLLMGCDEPPAPQFVQFDPSDAGVMRLWKELGVPREDALDGRVSMTEGALDESVWPYISSGLWNADSWALVGNDVSRALDVLGRAGPTKTRQLLLTGTPETSCPDGITARTIYGNILNDVYEPNWDEYGYVIPERQCVSELLRTYSAQELAGVFLGEDGMALSWVGAGQSVVPIRTLKWFNDEVPFASAVIVSPEGHVLTAAHAIPDVPWYVPWTDSYEDCSDSPMTFLRIGETRHGLCPASLLHSNFDDENRFIDVALYQIPALKGRVPHWARLAERRPTAGTAIMSIGYPGWGTRGDIFGQDEIYRAYTMGIFPFHQLAPRHAILLGSRIFYGNSGGGTFDAEGRLLGINTAIIINARTYQAAYSQAMSVFPEDYADSDPELSRLLSEIRKIQEAY